MVVGVGVALVGLQCNRLIAAARISWVFQIGMHIPCHELLCTCVKLYMRATCSVGCGVDVSQGQLDTLSCRSPHGVTCAPEQAVPWRDAGRQVAHRVDDQAQVLPDDQLRTSPNSG